MSDYNTNKQTNYATNEGNSSLYVLQGRIKKKGICTCEKKMPCRGTCISR